MEAAATTSICRRLHGYRNSFWRKEHHEKVVVAGVMAKAQWKGDGERWGVALIVTPRFNHVYN